MSKTKRPITFTVDSDGFEIATVPLANTSHSAVLYRADYEAALEAGLSPRWFFNDNGSGDRYVRANGVKAGNLIGVARVITGAGRRQSVKYRNDDRLDLRRGNLRVVKSGSAKRADAALLGRDCQAGEEPVTAS